MSSTKLVLHLQYLPHLTFCLCWAHPVIFLYQNVCCLVLFVDRRRMNGMIWQHLREGMWLCWVGKLEDPLDCFGSWLRSIDYETGPVDWSWLPVLYVASELPTKWYLTGTKVDIGQFGGQILICAGWYEKLVTCEILTEKLKNTQKHDRNFKMWTSCEVAKGPSLRALVMG